jgi:drug/metabolite transporter (DMT)-like permease
VRSVNHSQELKGEALLLLAAMIWGLSFIFQRIGMKTIGPFAFNGLRFCLASVFVWPMALFFRSRTLRANRAPIGVSVKAGAIAGLALFAGASFQQVGMVSTTAGNAGFITGLYVILVPMLGLFLGRKAPILVWFGAVLAVIGLYLLSTQGGAIGFSHGDCLELIGAFCWAAHITLVGLFSGKSDPLVLSATQFTVSAILSLFLALPLEGIQASEVTQSMVPLLYSGIISIGIGFTLQVIGQRTAHPARASIIMSLESLFAALCGIFFLGEPATAYTLSGSGLILAGMVLAQIEPVNLRAKWRKAKE